MCTSREKFIQRKKLREKGKKYQGSPSENRQGGIGGKMVAGATGVSASEPAKWHLEAKGILGGRHGMTLKVQNVIKGYGIKVL